MDIYERIVLAAGRLAQYVRDTPLEHSPALSSEGGPGTTVWLKCENLQHTGSFKVRGALNKVLTLPADLLAKGVVTASTGNHGRGVAHALTLTGQRGTIYMPTTAVPRKVEALRRYPAVTVERLGDEMGVTEVRAREIATGSGRVYISPYNDVDVIAGQGTIGLELWRAMPEIDTVFVAVGGGGLIVGIASILKAHNPAVRVIGCWPANAPALSRCLQAGKIIPVEERTTLSDGTAGGVEPDAITFDLARTLIDDHVLVTESEIADAIRFVLAEHHLVIEGAAAVAVAAYRKGAPQYQGRSVGIILCGGNLPYDTLCDIVGTPARGTLHPNDPEG